MAKRWPPILGLTGFDGGTKPAIALATRSGRLQGGEGEQVPVDRGPGACCYNDGTCDDISEFDCISAGGQWRGPGTTCADVPNPCVGACCEPGCVENTTPDGCALDGGTFQGFGTTCDTDPCPGTGACCIGTSCSIETPEDCAASGGIYFGDGTPCIPNPCVTDCNSGVDCLTPGCTNPSPGVWVFNFTEVFDGVCYHCGCAQDPHCPFVDHDHCACVGTHPPSLGWTICFSPPP